MPSGVRRTIDQCHQIGLAGELEFTQAPGDVHVHPHSKQVGGNRVADQGKTKFGVQRYPGTRALE